MKLFLLRTGTMAMSAGRLAGIVAWSVLAAALAQAAAQPVELREPIAVGNFYRVSCRVSLQGTMRLPADKPGAAPTVLPFTGSSQIDYVERILETAPNGEVVRTIRVYERMDFQRKLGDQEQSSRLRPAARRMVVMRRGHLEVPFSPDGPLLWSEIDRVRTDVFPPALAALLPSQPVQVGESWKARTEAILELTDLEKITDGQLECRLEQVLSREGRRIAQVSFRGTISGVAEDGPARHHLSGILYFDLSNQVLTYLSLEGKQSLLDSDGKVVSELQGQFVLTRQRLREVLELSDAALQGLKLVPDETNTRLLFDEPTLGVSFVYPRRWTVRRADARQVVLDEPNGGAVLITLDPPGRTVTGLQYQQQVEQWLAKEKAAVYRRSPVKSVPGAAAQVEHFQYEVDLQGERLILDYYTSAQSGGGATLAARVRVAQAQLLDDVAVMALSLRRSPPPR